MRSLSNAIKNVLAQEYAETHDVLDITLPQMSGDTVPISLHFATTSLIISGVQYLPLIRQIASIKFSLGKASDSAEVDIGNEDSAYAGILSSTDRSLSGSTVELKRLFLVDEAARTFESDIMMIGYVRDWSLDEDLIRLTIISDLSKRGTQVGNRVLTQRCVWKFKGVECGYVGAGSVCTKVFDDGTGGCLFYNNQHRFGGVPPLEPNASVVAGGGITNGGNGLIYDGSGIQDFWDWDYQSNGRYVDMRNVF